MFEGISLEDLENSEEAIVNITTEQTEDSKKPKKEVKKDDNEDEEDIDPGFTLSIDELDSVSLEDEDEEDTDINIETPAKKSTKTEQKISSQDTFTSLASALVEAGVFSSLEQEDIDSIKDADTILDAIAKEIKSKELSDLTEEQKNYVKALRDGIPHDIYHTRKSTIDQYNKLTEDQIKTNQTLQLELIRRNFIINGASEDKAKKMARLAITSEDAAEDALEAKNALVAFEEDSLQEELDKAEQTKADKLKKTTEELATLKSKINETAELIPGIKVNSQTKDKVYESMVSPVSQKDNQLLNEVMEAYKTPEYKIKLHALHVITKGFTDFSKFISTQKSDAVKALNEKLKGTDTSIIGHNHNSMTNSGNGKTSNSIKQALEATNFLHNK